MGEILWVMLRGVLLAEAIVVVMAILVILRRLRRERTEDALMPKHIVSVSVGSLIVACAIGSTQITNLTVEPDWNSVPVLIVGYGIFLFGLWLMLTYQNRTYGTRSDRHDEPGVSDYGTGLTVPVVVLFAFCMVGTGFAIYAIEKEANERKDQNCLSFEGAHRDEVRQLGDTYKFIAQQTDTERNSTLSRFVTSGLDQLEKEAASDSDNSGVQVPKYCDDPDVGLDEPDPVVPKRPDNLELSK